MRALRDRAHEVRVRVAAVASAAEPIYDLSSISHPGTTVEFATRITGLCQLCLSLLSAGRISEADPNAVFRSAQTSLRLHCLEMHLQADQLRSAAGSSSETHFQTHVSAVREA